MPSVKLVEFDLINCKMKQEHTLEFQAGNVWDAKIYSDQSFNNPKIKGFDLEDCGEIIIKSNEENLITTTNTSANEHVIIGYNDIRKWSSGNSTAFQINQLKNSSIEFLTNDIRRMTLINDGCLRLEKGDLPMDEPRTHLNVGRGDSISTVLFGIGVRKELYNSAFPANAGTQIYESAYIGTTNRYLHIGTVFGSAGVPDDTIPHMKIDNADGQNTAIGCKVQIDGKLKLNQFAKDTTDSYNNLTYWVNNDNRSGLIIATKETDDIGGSILLARKHFENKYFHSKIWHGYDSSVGEDYLGFRCCGGDKAAQNANADKSRYDFRIQDNGMLLIGENVQNATRYLGMYWDDDYDTTSNSPYYGIARGRGNWGTDLKADLNWNHGWNMRSTYGGLTYYRHNSDTTFSFMDPGQMRSNLFYNSSDDRLKHNEQPITDALGTINQLRPTKYLKTLDMKDASGNAYGADHHFADTSPENLPEGTRLEAGFIAQEVREIPELAYTVELVTPNNEAPGPEAEEKYPLSLRYNDIMVHAVAAIQELSKRVEELEQEIIQLKSN